MIKHHDDPSPTAEDARTIEDINREAAAARASYREGVEWIEDRRSRPRRPGGDPEGRPS